MSDIAFSSGIQEFFKEAFLTSHLNKDLKPMKPSNLESFKGMGKMQGNRLYDYSFPMGMGNIYPGLTGQMMPNMNFFGRNNMGQNVPLNPLFQPGDITREMRQQGY